MAIRIETTRHPRKGWKGAQVERVLLNFASNLSVQTSAANSGPPLHLQQSTMASEYRFERRSAGSRRLTTRV